jgi:hypothetical protein
MMMRRILASTALASLLASGAYAQTTTEEPIIEEENAPAAQSEEAPADVMPEAETAEDPAMADDPAMAEDPAAADDPALAEDPAIAEDPALADDPAMADDPAVAEDPALADDPAVAEDPALAEDPAMAADPAMEGWTKVENEALSAETLMGADVQTMDGESIATIDDVLLTPEGQVESLVATFGGFLGFGTNTVELSLEEAEVYTDEGGTMIVRTSLTPEDLEGRPEYEEEPVEG